MNNDFEHPIDLKVIRLPEIDPKEGGRSTKRSTNAFKAKGVITVGFVPMGEVRVSWRSRLRPVILARGLLTKLWKTGFSVKEYLILFDIVSLQYRDWDEKVLRTGIVMLFLCSLRRKALSNWDSSLPALKTLVPLFLAERKSIRTIKDFNAEYHIPKLINIPLKGKTDFSMKTLYEPDRPPKAKSKPKTPSAVGTKSSRRYSKPPTLEDSGEILRRDLERIIESVLIEFSKWVGVSQIPEGAKWFPSKGSDENTGNVRNVKYLEQYVSLFERGES